MAILKILGLFFGESHRRTRVASQPRAKRLSPGFFSCAIGAGRSRLAAALTHVQ
jgi:hypothetical protein